MPCCPDEAGFGRMSLYHGRPSCLLAVAAVIPAPGVAPRLLSPFRLGQSQQPAPPWWARKDHVTQVGPDRMPRTFFVCCNVNVMVGLGPWGRWATGCLLAKSVRTGRGNTSMDRRTQRALRASPEPQDAAVPEPAQPKTSQTLELTNLLGPFTS